MANNDYYSVVRRFRDLTTEGQKEFLKEIFIEGYFGSYVENKVARVAETHGKEDTEEYREDLEKRVERAVDSLLKDLNSSDEELKCRIFERFVGSYGSVVSTTKKEICGFNHDFTDWVEGEGTIPVFDEDGDVDGFAFGKFYTRQCYYCGTVEKVYSEEAMKQKEHESEYCKNRLGKNQTYIMKRKNEN